jgi:hypothetical protein
MKLIIKLLIVWIVMITIFSFYSEYVISRGMSTFLQIILTSTIFICIVLSINITIKLITKKQEKQ